MTEDVCTAVPNRAWGVATEALDGPGGLPGNRLLGT